MTDRKNPTELLVENEPISVKILEDSLRVLNIEKGIKILFSATLDNVDRAAEEIERHLNDMGMSRMIFNIILGVREALINAVKHGSHDDEEKHVICKLERDCIGLTIIIEDEGEGFDWRKYLLKEISSTDYSGRGIVIMREYFKDMEYNEKGNRVTLKI